MHILHFYFVGQTYIKFIFWIFVCHQKNTSIMWSVRKKNKACREISVVVESNESESKSESQTSRVQVQVRVLYQSSPSPRPSPWYPSMSPSPESLYKILHTILYIHVETHYFSVNIIFTSFSHASINWRSQYYWCDKTVLNISSDVSHTNVSCEIRISRKSQLKICRALSSLFCLLQI